MLDFADLVAINKFDRQGSEDALRDVAQADPAQPHGLWHVSPDKMPVYGTIASKFNDHGVTELYLALLDGPEQEHRHRFQQSPPLLRPPLLPGQDRARAAGAQPLPGRDRRDRVRGITR